MQLTAITRVLSVAAASLVLAAPLAGCDSERAQIDLHKPGQYTGKTDPLLAKTQGGANDEAIRKRFAMIQTDR